MAEPSNNCSNIVRSSYASVTLYHISPLNQVRFEGYADKYAEVVNRVSCFPHGIDMISAGMIAATHFSVHQGPETHFIHWIGALVDIDNGWRITEEDLSTIGHSVLPKAE